jgi:CRP-like cAMP-binding protein
LGKELPQELCYDELMKKENSPVPAIPGHALFGELSAAARTAVRAAGREQIVRTGEYFFHQGEPSLLLYIVTTGQVKLTQVTAAGDQVVVGYVGPGGGLGIIVALSDMPYPLSALAVEECRAVVWSRETMKGLMRRYPQLAFNGLEMIAGRFLQLQEQFQDLATKRVEQRVARALLRLVRQFGRRVEGGVLIDMPLSRQSLAEMTGTNQYNVSRIVRQWEKAGVVRSEREQITILRAHDLVSIGEDL